MTRKQPQIQLVVCPVSSSRGRSFHPRNVVMNIHYCDLSTHRLVLVVVCLTWTENGKTRGRGEINGMGKVIWTFSSLPDSQDYYQNVMSSSRQEKNLEEKEGRRRSPSLSCNCSFWLVVMVLLVRFSNAQPKKNAEFFSHREFFLVEYIFFINIWRRVWIY